ncbi:hypothetical protein [Bradyrhizobium lablabi]|nr:hypothetical protein [Bradyrhizobium lablabi]
MRLETQRAELPQGERREALTARIEQLRTAAEMHAMLTRQA